MIRSITNFFTWNIFGKKIKPFLQVKFDDIKHDDSNSKINSDDVMNKIKSDVFFCKCCDYKLHGCRIVNSELHAITKFVNNKINMIFEEKKQIKKMEKIKQIDQTDQIYQLDQLDHIDENNEKIIREWLENKSTIVLKRFISTYNLIFLIQNYNQNYYNTYIKHQKKKNKYIELIIAYIYMSLFDI